MEASGQGGGVNKSSTGSDVGDPDAMFLTVSGRDQSVRKSTAVVTALFIIASIGLVLMAKKSHIQSASATSAADSQTKIEMAISRVTGASSEMTTRMDEVVQKFHQFSDVLQVEVDELQKNPFELAFLPVEAEVRESPGPDEKVKSLLRQFDVEKGTLSLISIILSESSACCMINGVLLERGQRLNAFIVENIQADHVQLRWEPEGMRANSLPRDSVTVTLALKD
jgi:preprotein translocase subunit SecG